MPIPSLVLAPDPVFRRKAQWVKQVTDETRNLVEAMYAVLYAEKGIGLGANMVGVTERIAIIDLQENGRRAPFTLIDPEITWQSDSLQTFEEASLSFPGISAEVSRSDAVTVRYLDYDGASQERTVSGWLAQVVQHEMDYLDGKTYLDRLSATKRNMLLRRYKKLRR